MELYRPTNLDVSPHYERKVLESVLKSSVRVLINPDRSHKENVAAILYATGVTWNFN